MIATLTIGKRRAFSPWESGSRARILHLRRCRRVGDVVKAAVARACSSLPSVSRCRCGQPSHCPPTPVAESRTPDARRPARPLRPRGKTCGHRRRLWSGGGGGVGLWGGVVGGGGAGRAGGGRAPGSRLGQERRGGGGGREESSAVCASF